MHITQPSFTMTQMGIHSIVSVQRNQLPANQSKISNDSFVKPSSSKAPHFAGRNQLHECLENGDFTAMEEFLSIPRSIRDLSKLVNEKDRQGNTPIHLAAKKYSSSTAYLIMLLDCSLDKSKSLQLENNQKEPPASYLTDAQKMDLAAQLQMASS